MLKILKTRQFLLAAGVVIFLLINNKSVLGQNLTKKEVKKIAVVPTSKPSPTLTPTLVPTSTPIPVVYPSEKSLKIARFLWIRNNEENQAQIRAKLGGSTDSETINNWALEMDKNPSILAANEALVYQVEQSTSEEYAPTQQTNQYNTYTAPQTYHQNTSCYTSGDYTHCSDGTTAFQSGDTTFVNGGINGNSGTCYTSGSYTHCSDGSSANNTGNVSFVYGSSGSSTCTHIGNFTNCN